jgi:hypothetical protein
MIVTYKEKGWQVVTQRAHGMLAAQIAFQWKKKDRPARWLETLLAIAEHDDAEIELDGEKLLTPTGGPLNYSMKEFDKIHCEKVAMLTNTKSRYIALLTSLHMDFLYHDQAKTDTEVAQFLKVQKSIRDAIQKKLRISQTEIKRVYALLQWCDALSLILCQDLIQPEKRLIEISIGPDKRPSYLFQIRKGVLSVDPWPFEKNEFALCFESRLLSQLKFDNATQFRKVFSQASVLETGWKMQKKPRGFVRPT